METSQHVGLNGDSAAAMGWWRSAVVDAATSEGEARGKDSIAPEMQTPNQKTGPSQPGGASRTGNPSKTPQSTPKHLSCHNAVGSRINFAKPDDESASPVEGVIVSYDEDMDTYTVQVGDEQMLITRDKVHPNTSLAKTPNSRTKNRMTVREGESLPEAEKRLGTGTIKSCCFQVLKTAGPAGLSLQDIVQTTTKLGLKDWSAVKHPSNTVNAILSMDSAFVRSAPGRFALRAHESTVCVGQTVLRNFPEDGEWLEATVADYDGTSGQHRLVYRVGTPRETFEWMDISSLGPDMLRYNVPDPDSKGGAYKCEGCLKAFDSVGGLRMHSARWCSLSSAAAAGLDGGPAGGEKTPGSSKRKASASSSALEGAGTGGDRDGTPGGGHLAQRLAGDDNQADGGDQQLACQQCLRRFQSLNGLRMHVSRWCPMRTGGEGGVGGRGGGGSAGGQQGGAGAGGGGIQAGGDNNSPTGEHGGMGDSKYQCIWCRKEFQSQGGLRMHASRWCAARPGYDPNKPGGGESNEAEELQQQQQQQHQQEIQQQQQGGTNPMQQGVGVNVGGAAGRPPFNLPSGFNQESTQQMAAALAAAAASQQQQQAQQQQQQQAQEAAHLAAALRGQAAAAGGAGAGGGAGGASTGLGLGLGIGVTAGAEQLSGGMGAAAGMGGLPGLEGLAMLSAASGHQGGLQGLGGMGATAAHHAAMLTAASNAGIQLPPGLPMGAQHAAMQAVLQRSQQHEGATLSETFSHILNRSEAALQGYQYPSPADAMNGMRG